MSDYLNEIYFRADAPSVPDEAAMLERLQSENAALVKQVEAMKEALRVADEALALVPVDNPRRGPDAKRARAEIYRASNLERSK